MYKRKDPDISVLHNGKKYISLKDMALRVSMVPQHLRLLARTRIELGAIKRGRRWYFNIEITEKALETLYGDYRKPNDFQQGLISDL